jgi:iron(III) transport system substrate-binding protein
VKCTTEDDRGPAQGQGTCRFPIQLPRFVRRLLAFLSRSAVPRPEQLVSSSIPSWPPSNPQTMSLRRPVLLALLGVLLAACGRAPDLVVYCSLDQEFSEDLMRRFEAETGLTVRAEYDIEANKNVGLASRIREERGRVRCDVFWSNEFAQVVSMAEEGLLAPYDSPSAADIPEGFRDPERRWTGFAARARVFIVNTELAEPAEIRSMWDLVDPRWSGKVAMARPLAGTTPTHMAALYPVLGEAEARRYVETVARLADEGALQLATGNAHVMRLVREGQCAFGWTDTDDFHVAREGGYPVAAVYPDQDGIGTLLIPNTIAVIAGGPHPEAARRFVDWALRPEIEAELAASRSAQIPVRASVARPAHVVDARDFEPMAVDFAEVGKSITARTAEFQQLFLR